MASTLRSRACYPDSRVFCPTSSVSRRFPCFSEVTPRFFLGQTRNLGRLIEKKNLFGLSERSKPLNPDYQLLFGLLPVREFLLLMGDVSVSEVVYPLHQSQEVPSTCDLKLHSHRLKYATDTGAVIEGSRGPSPLWAWMNTRQGVSPPVSGAQEMERRGDVPP